MTAMLGECGAVFVRCCAVLESAMRCDGADARGFQNASGHLHGVPETVGICIYIQRAGCQGHRSDEQRGMFMICMHGCCCATFMLAYSSSRIESRMLLYGFTHWKIYTSTVCYADQLRSRRYSYSMWHLPCDFCSIPTYKLLCKVILQQCN